MRSVPAIFIAAAMLSISASSANAAPFSGRWVPIASATAEYCLDGECAAFPVDASIDLNMPEGPDGLALMRTTAGFDPFGLEFDLVQGSIFAVADSADYPFDHSILGDLPGILTYELTVRFNSDASLSLIGFERATHPLGQLEVRFDDVEFVPTPEPSSAVLIGMGVAALATRRHRTSRS